jgi:hypothetical protein
MPKSALGPGKVSKQEGTYMVRFAYGRTHPSRCAGYSTLDTGTGSRVTVSTLRGHAGKGDKH